MFCCYQHWRRRIHLLCSLHSIANGLYTTHTKAAFQRWVKWLAQADRIELRELLPDFTKVKRLLFRDEGGSGTGSPSKKHTNTAGGSSAKTQQRISDGGSSKGLQVVVFGGSGGGSVKSVKQQFIGALSTLLLREHNANNNDSSQVNTTHSQSNVLYILEDGESVPTPRSTGSHITSFLYEK